MNSRQRRKANKMYKEIQDWVVIRLRMSGDISESEIKSFIAQENFLLKRLSPPGSYLPYMAKAAHEVGIVSYVKERWFGVKE